MPAELRIDGTIACRAVNTSIRVVCSNAITVALPHARADQVTVKHTQSVHERLADAQEVLGASETSGDSRAHCLAPAQSSSARHSRWRCR